MTIVSEAIQFLGLLGCIAAPVIAVGLLLTIFALATLTKPSNHPNKKTPPPTH